MGRKMEHAARMDYSARTDYWLQTAIQRLQADGFTIRNQNYFKVVAHRSRFELSKFGNCEAYFVFAGKTESPPTHYGAGEMRVAYDAARHQLYYFDQTPLWGWAYYAGFRRQI